VAVAARHAQQRLADLTLSSAPKIAIIDWDVHHGNGTQDVFASDPSVLFISMHQAIYPGTGAPHEVGKGEGEGATINVVLPGDAGHCAALQVWDEVIAPAVKRFGADFLLVSAGYDAHWQDPLAGLQFRSTTYHDLSQRAVKLAGEVCHGRLVFLLEGGYHLDALGQSVASTFAGVVGAPPVDALADPGLLRDEPKDKIANALAETKRIHGI
jgi:acetoin utilization deacetylase AcuC-like enzyme